jgi:hypothetical protein
LSDCRRLVRRQRAWAQRRLGYCPCQPNDFGSPTLFAGSGFQLVFDEGRVGVDCACLTSTPPIHGAREGRGGSDFAATCTRAYRSRRIACDDPLSGSRCGAGAARSEATRSFVHFPSPKSSPGQLRGHQAACGNPDGREKAMTRWSASLAEASCARSACQRHSSLPPAVGRQWHARIGRPRRWGPTAAWTIFVFVVGMRGHDQARCSPHGARSPEFCEI